MIDYDQLRKDLREVLLMGLAGFVAVAIYFMLIELINPHWCPNILEAMRELQQKRTLTPDEVRTLEKLRQWAIQANCTNRTKET